MDGFMGGIRITALFSGGHCGLYTAVMFAALCKILYVSENESV